MRRLILSALVATVGCSAGSHTGPESLGSTAQGVTVAPADDDDGNGKVPKLRVVPHHGPGNAYGVGSGDGGTQSGPGWTPLDNWASFSAGAALLLTDGTVMMPDVFSGNWWKLTPDNTGSYVKGSWTQLASPPDGYQPLYFASAVLPDGRVIIEGGEYQALNPAWQTTGAIYDPTKDEWTTVAPPAGWTTIGDAQSTVLADGRFYLANCCTKDAAILDPKALTWTAFGSTGKADINDEEGWTLLPNGDILTVDTNDLTNLQNSEIWSPLTASWTSAGDTGVQLADIAADGSGSWEMGPQMLRPDGTVFAAGALGQNAVYHTRTGKWTTAPSFPVIAGEGQLDTADGPAVLAPDGHVLVTASPGIFNVPLHIFDFDGTKLTEIASPPDAPNDSSFNASFLLLPNGQVLFTDQTNDIEIYSPSGQPSPAWAPQISGCELGALEPGSTYRLDGAQLHGLSQAVAYGDDEQVATNYPLVRIINRKTGHVFYSRTHGHSTMSIAPGVESYTFFDVPAAQELGESELVAVANGIASEPISVNVTKAR
jgi:hypothetical protein